MTVLRQWMIVLISAAVLSVGIHTVVFSIQVNNYFVNYSKTNYQVHVGQIKEFSQKALTDQNYTNQQIQMQLETHLSDPIYQIRLYSVDGTLVAEVKSDSPNPMGPMNGKGMMGGKSMMNQMMGKMTAETDSYTLKNNGTAIGQLNITRYSSIGDSLDTRMFRMSLIESSLISFLIVLVFVSIIGFFISKRMSRDLRRTALQAKEIELGDSRPAEQSRIKEIHSIQQSLESLQTRLKLKQTSRKKLVDELVHQTRTPLTILRTHLEGVEDGVIEMNEKEIRVCASQIDNITSIITNMSSLIDADNEISPISIEQTELHQLLSQIMDGLSVQFEKKQIALQLKNQQKIFLKTDRYKLSQVVYNLLTNAYKFTEPSGSVTVEYAEKDEQIQIMIRDTGIGIREEEQSRLFDAYYRGSNAEQAPGEGIGLYVVKENLNAVHGEVQVRSEPGKGSLFTILIPKEI